jgi:hypothetical protein
MKYTKAHNLSLIRAFLLGIFILAIAPATQAQLAASEIEILSYFDAEPITVDYSCPIGKLVDFTVDVSNPTVAETSDIDLNFRLQLGEFLQLKNGGLAFALPYGFNLGDMTVTGIEDSFEPIDYEIDLVRKFGRVFFVYLTRNYWSDSSGTYRLTTYVDINLRLQSVGLPQWAGDYNAAGIAFDQNKRLIAGPSLSDWFEILPGPPTSISVEPDTAMTVRAGQVIPFTALAVDAYGNDAGEVEADWMLAEGSDPVGVLSGSTLYTEKVGQCRVQATFEDQAAVSGIITVLPGELAVIDLDIATSQVVSHPLMTRAQMTLFDAYGNLKTDYDLAGNPIHLTVSEGDLTPAMVDDAALFHDGVIDLLPLSITYTGPSATTEILVENNGASGSAVVALNGYDILDVLGDDGGTFGYVFAGVETTVWILVRNGGNLTASEQPLLSARYMLDGGLVETTFVPAAFYAVDTIEVVLPPHATLPDEDNLVVSLEAVYEIDGAYLTTYDTLVLPIEVSPSSQFDVVDGSFMPDTVYASVPFEVSFDIYGGTFDGPIDRTDLTVTLTDGPAGGSAEIYSGSPEATGLSEGVISYAGIEALVPGEMNLPAGWYRVHLNYELMSDGSVFTIANPYPDSIYLLDEAGLSYVPNSLSPQMVYAGAENVFSFDLVLDESFPTKVTIESGSFTIEGAGFSTTQSLVVPNGSLTPGVNHVETRPLYVPSDQVGQTLAVSTAVTYRTPFTGDHIFSFVSDFDGLQLAVNPRAEVQIIDVAIDVPNSPRVNTGQQFQLVCRVANAGEIAVESLHLAMTSDGSSVFDPDKVVSLPAGDTVTVLFDVTAASVPTEQEMLTVDIVPNSIFPLPPVNHTALLIVEQPAELVLEYDLFGLKNSVIDRGAEFSLGVRLSNLGTGSASAVDYVLFTGDVNFGDEYPDSGPIHVGDYLVFPFVAPPFDTTVTFEFYLTGRPVEANTNLPAAISDTSFSFEVRVQAVEGDLMVTAQTVGTNLVKIGHSKEMLQLDFDNNAASANSIVAIQSLKVSFFDDRQRPLAVDGLLNTDSTELYLGGQLVSSVDLLDNSLTFTIYGVTVRPGESLPLVLVTLFERTVSSTVTLRLDIGQVEAEYVDGPFVGRQPRVTAADDAFIRSFTFVFRGASFEESVVVENNPFNPNEQPLRMAYDLAVPSPVEIRIYTVTGEEVYSWDVPTGHDGAKVGENIFEWDGRNSSSLGVMNGVYIVSVKILATGEHSRRKVGVVR